MIGNLLALYAAAAAAAAFMLAQEQHLVLVVLVAAALEVFTRMEAAIPERPTLEAVAELGRARLNLLVAVLAALALW